MAGNTKPIGTVYGSKFGLSFTQVDYYLKLVTSATQVDWFMCVNCRVGLLWGRWKSEGAEQTSSIGW